ncbi:hypothetical protein JCM17846_06950 [Iodidimonas nitroreducens]|uniref:Uncharacterized protein n=1 Tax=Iodidimonas nitroreducens TaxID=1236968 RepID=A0A5A7N414_9PROT|nr:hypothetical protein JCM17846_06950 [Iodidimonas nitroreducens]
MPGPFLRIGQSLPAGFGGIGGLYINIDAIHTKQACRSIPIRLHLHLRLCRPTYAEYHEGKKHWGKKHWDHHHCRKAQPHIFVLLWFAPP